MGPDMTDYVALRDKSPRQSSQAIFKRSAALYHNSAHGKLLFDLQYTCPQQSNNSVAVKVRKQQVVHVSRN